jgi:LPS sulfotransferase NodH
MKAFLRRLPAPLRKRVLDLGLGGHRAYTPFVVLGRSRVGSNLLRSLLNAHPGVIAFGEIFRDVGSLDWDHAGYFQSSTARSLVANDPVSLLERHVLGRYPRAVQAVGFKLFYYHAREGAQAAIWPYLQARTDIRVIHITRRNLLQTHLSRKRAAMTDRWVDTRGQDEAPAALELDFDECLGDFQQTTAWQQQCDHDFAGHPRLPVEYEALAADYRGEAARIQAFLGVPRVDVRPSTFQQARQPLSASIANYADLKRRFAGTPWAGFFTD